jgi:hypothetical protein
MNCNEDVYVLLSVNAALRCNINQLGRLFVDSDNKFDAFRKPFDG